MTRSIAVLVALFPFLLAIMTFGQQVAVPPPIPPGPEAKTPYGLTNQDALRALRDEGLRPAMILLDLMMPGMDGYTVIQKLRGNEKFKKLPIIAVTAQAMKNDREKGLVFRGLGYDVLRPTRAHVVYQGTRVLVLLAQALARRQAA